MATESPDFLAAKDPVSYFTRHRLFMLRAVRWAVWYGMPIEPATAAAIQAMARQIRAVSAELITEELRRLLVAPFRAQGINLLYDMGLVEPLLPELLPMKGLPQGLPATPLGDLWDHVMAVLDALGKEVSFPLALAALLHDVGKPRVVARTAERYTFYHHEHVGRRMAAEICRRLKLAEPERERVEWLVEKHQYLADAPRMRPAKLKAILGHPGIEELLRLHEADARASGTSLDHVRYCLNLLNEQPVEVMRSP